MLILIIGFLISILIVNAFEKELGWALAGAVTLVSVYLALTFPSSSGEEKLVKQTELVSLSNETVSQGDGSIFYVSISGDNVYTYRHKINSSKQSNTSKEYRVDTISGDVVESEDPNCIQPMLLEYRTTYKPTIWSFSLGFNTRYVFYVPENTIKKDIKLK